MRLPRRVTVIVAATIVVAACGTQLRVGPTPSPSANPWLSDHEIARAIEFREKLGLQSNEGWVRQVAEMPEAAEGVLAYSVPLTPVELDVLERRATAIDAVLDGVEDYGAAHPDDWGGATKEPATGAVVARFSDNTEQHETALRAMLGPGARLTVLKVRWSLVDLAPVFERIHDDWIDGSWLLDQGIYTIGLGVDPVKNQVTLDVSSARSDLDALLEDRYDAPQMVTVTSDGTGVRLLPTGALRGRVVDANGRPVEAVQVELESSVAGTHATGDVGIETNDHGRFRFLDIPAVQYTVLVYSNDPVATRTLLGSGRVRVAAGTTTNVEVAIP
jgi:hypothetical protein